MKKEDELLKQLMEMTKDTKAGKIRWNIKCQTTEFNDVDKKVVIKDNGVEWTSDECYVSYYCQYKGKEFLMITYEMILTAGSQVKTTNLVFLPPLGIRFFDINTLLPYSVEASNMLCYQIKALWELVLDIRKNNPDAIDFDVEERVLVIED